MTPREACGEIANLRLAAAAYRFAAVQATDEEQMVCTLRDWLATEKATQLLVDEFSQEMTQPPG